ncbi:MAG: sugar ABC transporter permease, partial [Planctomycetes bacterium]|nr:sugar ABC transporter permease [Planctomycetota bacterium]
FYIYLTGFSDFRLGLASAIAWTMFVMILAVTLVQWRFGSRQINA